MSDNTIPKARPPHLWKKGQSGNPKGMPKGTRHKATRAAEALLDGQGDALTAKCIEMALAGDPVAMRLALERILPPRKDRPVAVELPALATADDAAKAMASILAAVAAGELTPAEGTAIGGLVAGYARTLETATRAAPSVAISFAPRQTLGGDEPLPDEPVL